MNNLFELTCKFKLFTLISLHKSYLYIKLAGITV
jgi:hypothetical protein